MKKSILIFLVLICTAIGSLAQNVDCTQAVSQLQNYAAGVNRLYQDEYWRIIPNQRCPAYVYNQWGQLVPADPQLVQNCRYQMLAYLNQWYGSQCQYVNSWYAQIVNGCMSQPTSVTSRPAPRIEIGDSENNEIDTRQIEELTAGIDEDKALRINIPTTATGYKPIR